MATRNIIIFDVEDIEVETTKSAREMYKDTLLKAKIIDEPTADAFYDMLMEEEEKRMPATTIESIIVRQLLPYVRPVLESIPEVEYKRRRAAKKDANGTVSTKAAPMLTVMMEHDTECKFAEYSIMVSKQTTASLSGVQIMPHGIPRRQQIPAYLYDIPDAEKAKNGIITVYDPIRAAYITPLATAPKDIMLVKEKMKDTLQALKHQLTAAINFKGRDLWRMIARGQLGTGEKAAVPSPPSKKPASPPPSKKPASPPPSKFLLDMAKITGNAFVLDSTQGTLLSLQNAGYIDEYFKSRYTGAFLEEIKHERDLQRLQVEQMQAKFKLQMELYRKRGIALQTFGTDDLFALDAKQLAVVEKAYGAFVKRAQAPDKDLQMAYSMQLAIDAGDVVALTKLIKLVDAELSFDKASGFYRNKAGHNILCDHLMAVAKVVISKLPLGERHVVARERMSTFAEMMDGGYFCRNCGEFLFDQDVSIAESSRINYNSGRDESFSPLATVIAREAVYIVANYVVFPDPAALDMRGIAKNVAETVRDELAHLDEQLGRMKTLSQENRVITMSIYIYVYIFATLCQLVFTNQAKMHFRDIFKRAAIKQGGKAALADGSLPKFTKRREEDLRAIINNALNMVKYIKSEDLRRSDVIKQDTVKDFFLKAYRWVLRLNYVSIPYVHESNPLKNNPVLDYMRRVQSFSRHKDAEGPHATEKLLGRTEKQIIADEANGVSMYSTMRQMELPKEWEYAELSYRQVYSLIRREVLPAKDAERIDQLERERRSESLLRRLRPYVRLPYVPMPKKVYEPYCCSKRRPVYGPRSTKTARRESAHGAKTRQFKRAEVVEWINSNNTAALQEFAKWRVVGFECQSCDTTRKAKSADADAFFADTCPVEDVHEYKTTKLGTVCKKCGYDPAAAPGSRKYEAFYKKYKKKYLAIREAIDKTAAPAKSTAPAKSAATAPAKQRYKWEVNHKQINEFIRLSKVDMNKFYALGLFEGQNLDDIKMGKLNMQDFSEADIKKRNNHLYEHYIYIMRNYNVLRNIDKLIVYPENIRQFISKHGIKDYSKKEPINVGFLDMYKYFATTLKPGDLSVFLLSAIANTLMRIVATFPKKETGLEYIHILYGEVLDAEEKLTSFTPTKFREVQSVAEERDDIVVERAEDFDTIMDDEGGEDEGDPFSIDALDMDSDNEDNLEGHGEELSA